MSGSDVVVSRSGGGGGGNGQVERDIEQAITALKKGAYLLKYGRRGKPKFCPFRLANDESILIWFSGKEEKQLRLSHVTRIVSGQRTPIFQRYPRPEKEYQSFSLIYSDRSLDVICKDKDEAEVWFSGLKALISRGHQRNWSSHSRNDEIPSEANSPRTYTQRSSPLLGLNLSNNHLNGGIPDSIGDMKALNSLDFSGNQLTGPIPPSIGTLHFLSYLNLSHNNLSGQIPTGNQLQTLTDPSIYVGNKDLCGAPLPKNCSNNEDQTPTHKNNSKAANHKSNKVWFYMDIMCGFAAGFWGVIGVLLFKKHWRHKLFMFAEETVDKIYVAVVLRVDKMKRRRESA